MIAASGVVSTKLDTAETRFNKRAVECRLAAALLGKALGHSSAVTLGDVAAHFLASPAAASADTSRSVVPASVVCSVLHEAPYSLEEVAALLGEPVDAVSARCVIRRVRGNDFKLRQRALHVYAEAQRVRRFVAACVDEHSAYRSPSDQIAALGALMDESQASCRDLYECSCAELDAMCAIARAAGAAGARLTGAGWGGCVIALCDGAGNAERVVAALREKDYAARGACDLPCFATAPCRGASVHTVKRL